MLRIDDTVLRLLNGCIIRAYDGTALYTPDGTGHYPALWTRDFAYMLMYSGDLIPPANARACVEYLLAGTRPDGWIPDRVYADGKAAYTAGGEGFPAAPNLDNGPFLVLAADACLDLLPPHDANVIFSAWLPKLSAGLACLPADHDGIIENSGDPPHSPYGFTDCVRKTGKLAMETLLLWQAYGRLASRMERSGMKTDGIRKTIRSQETAFARIFSQDNGMLLAATGDCRQTDVWASCFAAAEGFPLPAGQKDRIARWLAENSRGIVKKGQIRHLPAGESWQSLFVKLAPGSYQNGAFWATATGWFFEAVVKRYPDLAASVIREVLEDFNDNGVFERLDEDGGKLDSYVVSAAGVRYVCRKYCGFLNSRGVDF